MDFLNAIVLFCNFVLVPATTYGAQLALGALGITVIYRILRFANFAHSELMSWGAMLTLFMTWYLQSVGIHAGPLPTALLALPVGILGAIAMALTTERTVYRFYRKQRASSITFAIVSVGVMFVMAGLTRFMIGPGEQVMADGQRFLIKAVEFKRMTGLDEGLAIKTTQVITIAAAIAMAGFLFWFLYRTRSGKAMRAFSDNEDLALLSGINPDRIVAIAWILAAILATLSGTLYGLDKSYKPFVFLQLLLPIFASAIVGGIGQPVGAILGGFVIAYSEVLLTYAYRKFATYLVPGDWKPEGLLQLLSTDYKFSISFIILVIVLLIRPTGIIRGKLL